ncbi:MFS general substrate transporter, partial [Aureobasidium melanogenum]
MTAGSSKDSIDVVEFEQPSQATTKLPDVYETEVTPLLGQNTASQNGTAIKDGKCQMSSRAILIVMGVLILIIQCADQFAEAPLTRIFESIYCYQYWEREDPTKILIPRSAIGPGALGGVEEQWCKVAEVQGKVAMLKGTQQFLECIPSLILSIPIGILADRWGRRPILVIGLCGFPLRIGWQLFVCWFWQNFNLRVSWFSALHALILGGSPVVSAVAMVVVSDVTNQESRSTVFLRIYSANLTSNLLCPPVVAWIMMRNPLVAVFMSIGCFCIGVPLSLLIPETLGYQQDFKPDENHSDEEDTTSTPRNQVKSFLEQCYKPLVGSTKYFLHDKRVILLITTFVPIMLTITIVPLLLQYASSRYSMTFASVTMLLTVRAGVTIAMFLFVQSCVYKLLANAGVSGQKRDLLLTRGSAGLMLVGWATIGFSPNAIFFTASLMIATMGNGFPVFLRSFLTGLVEPNRVAELYTIVGVVDTLGLMIGGPLLAWLFQRGMQLGGVFVGLPFVVLGLIYAIVTSFLLRIGHHKRKVMVEEGSE